ncbi:LysR family transcriptional regulator [Clostridium sp. AM58-1XD]|uniref:LysR family transcriptional regulator n=1 Tax=Clostridium sp. AM58-1XD TaxID=2292307 RepID=UPI0015F776DA|nr:LysR family transcriptional regulator [Clostridium sp. AM58-1XD]
MPKWNDENSCVPDSSGTGTIKITGGNYMRDIDWKIIVTLYDCKNVTKAANMLYMSQPTLSKNLNRIEAELGDKIIERSNKGVVFTESGEYLAMQAVEITKLISETMQTYKEMRLGSKVLSIGSASSFARYALPKLMSRYNDLNKENEIHYNVQVMTSSEIISMVQRQELKIGFVNGDRDWDSKVLCSVGYGYIISKNPLKMEDLPHLPMICHHRDAYSLKILSNWWRDHFKTPFHVTYTVSDIATSLKWIAAGMGYGIMYSTALGEDEQFYKIPMEDLNGNPVKRSTWMIYHPNNKKDQTIRKFIDFVSSLYPNEEEQPRN